MFKPQHPTMAHSAPSHIIIPHFQDYVHTRPRVATSASFLQDMSHLVASPIHSDSSGTPDDDRAQSSPLSQTGDSVHYQYASTDRDFSSSTPPELYDSAASYEPSTAQNTSDQPVTPYLFPEPTTQSMHLQRSTSFPQPQSAPHMQTHFPTNYEAGENYNSPQQSFPGRMTADGQYVAQSAPSSSLYDQRRMSEPALFAGAASYPTSTANTTNASVANARYQQFNYTYGPQAASSSQPSSPVYPPALHRAATCTGSLRDQYAFSSRTSGASSATEWKQEQVAYNLHGEPISPHQTHFSEKAQYTPTLGQSPPGSDTTSSSVPCFASTAQSVPLPPVDDSEGMDNFVDAPTSKTFSFVALPGNAIKKRPRRRYDEIERLYRCSWADCDKAYGTLNHLNAHVTMQKHGLKRSPDEFKELRKQWRKESKERKQTDGQHPTGLMRRASMGMIQDHPYDHRHQHMRFADSISPELESRQPRTRGSAEPLVSHRYTFPHREETDYASSTRHRYATTTPASWHQVGQSSSHSSLSQQYAVNEPTDTADGSAQSLSHLNLSLHIPSSQQQQFSPQSLPAPSHMVTDALPANSTLLTPLPGYEPPRMIHSPHIASNMGYSQESYGDGSN